MPRAHRYFLPNHVWHITHRCHKKEFLLEFAKDREAYWIKWLFEFWIQDHDLGLRFLTTWSSTLSDRCSRQPFWSNSIAVGNHAFIGQIRDRLTGRLTKRNIYKALPTEHFTDNQAIQQNYVDKQHATSSPIPDIHDLPRPTSSYMLKEHHCPYSAHLEGKMAVLSGEYGLFWSFYNNISDR
jgi:hypothetical protein